MNEAPPTDNNGTNDDDRERYQFGLLAMFFAMTTVAIACGIARSSGWAVAAATICLTYWLFLSAAIAKKIVG